MTRFYPFSGCLAFGLFCLMICAARPANAQQETNHARCASDEFLEQQLRQPGAPEAREALEAFTRAYRNQILREQPAAKTSEGAPGNAKFYIPCVVHVIHDGNPNTPDQPSAEQIRSQFVALNNDYRRVPGTVGYGAGVDMEIEFSLATRDPQGNPTTGINYYEDPELTILDRRTGEDLSLKTNYRWPDNQYANIYLVQEITGATAEESVLGYAKFPGVFERADGVVIRSDCFGTTGNIGGPGGANVLGRTAAHEFGHFLNLYHTFQDDCDQDSCHLSGDRVCDTPPANDPTFGLGFQRKNTCFETERRLAVDLPENLRNYMDYLSDYGMNFFTEEQRIRAHAALRNAGIPARSNIWQDDNLQNVGAGPYGAPVANFHANTRIGCPGQPITFYDYSTGSPTNYQWEFQGGTPATSNARFPQVTYSEPGVYSVILGVSNASNQSDQVFKEGFIVIDDNLVAENYNENFDGGNFPYTGTAILNHDAANDVVSQTWFRNDAGYLQINCGDYSDYGQIDDYLLPAFDFSGSEAAFVGFDYIYAPYEWGSSPESELIYSDTFSIDYSTDCGATWTTVFRRGGLELSSVGRVAPFIINTPSEDFWKRREAVCLTGAEGNANVRVRFRMKNGFGNNFFLDNLFVESTSRSFCSTVGRPEAQAEDLIAARPNPANESIRLSWKSEAKTGPVVIEIFDMKGARLLREELAGDGQNALDVDLRNFAAGVYAANIQLSGEIYSVKFIRQ